MVPVRPMYPDDEKHVRELHALCFPDSSETPPFFYFAHPTLVIAAAHRLIGFTSFTLSPDAKKGYVCYGVDLCVHPDDRRQGHARRLHAERCRIARDLGALDFVDSVDPVNEAATHLLVASGCRYVSSAEGRDFYVGRL